MGQRDSVFSRREFVGSVAGISAAALLGCPPQRDPVVAPPTIGNQPTGSYFAQFGVDDALLRAGLAAAMSSGADYADLFFQHKVSNHLVLEDGAVNRAYTSVGLGVGLRAVKGDQTGYAYTEELTVESVTRAGNTAATIADGPARTAPASFKVSSGLPDRYPLALPWEDVSAQRKLPILTGLNQRVFSADKRIVKATVVFSDEHGAILIADSLGRVVEDSQPMTRLRLSCVAEQNGKREQNGYNIAGRTGFDFYDEERLTRVVDEAVRRTVVLFDAVQPAAGEMPVVLGAGPSGILLHEAIGHGMEADFNRKDVSIYAERLGKLVAKPFVNVVDDATTQSARGAINVDDEGNAANKTMLVEDGVLATYLHDSISAKHYGVEPTGNGRRQGYQHVPMPRMRCTYMLPGPHTKPEIIASVKKGIYCESFRNGQVQIGAGDFTFYVGTGYLIEDGKLTKPIKDVNIIGNGPKALELIDMVSDDLAIDEGGWTCGKNGQSVPVSQGMPTARVAKLTVGGQS